MMRLSATLVLLVVMAFALVRCAAPEAANTEDKTYLFGGPAQGTSYMVKYHGPGLTDHQQSVDSILKAIDQSLSTYIPHSTISRFNNQMEFTTNDKHFIRMLFDSKDIRDMSDGAFEPAVMPLVKAWGFGPEGPRTEEPMNMDSLLALVSWDFDMQVTTAAEHGGSVRETIVHVEKTQPITLDFNGIAQGYTVDVIYDFLRSKGVENLMVEVGGELRAGGVNEQNQPWSIGVDDPTSETERGTQAVILLNNQAVATSGSYRKFYEKDGKRLSHTIDPQTGYPVDHQLLSATVVTSSATLADAFATVFMVYGPWRSMEFFAENPESGLYALLVYYDDEGELQTYLSPGMEDKIRKDPEE